MGTVRCVWVIAIILLGANAASAQAALTVLALKDALVSALEEMRQAMDEATYDIKSVGNSMQANVQNVILDIDRTLGRKLEYTFDKLDKQERRLAEDAERLLSLTKEATEALTKSNFERARTLVVDADILAYNTSYSLPCRTARPRVLDVTPPVIQADSESPIVKIRGNFLMQGVGLVIKIGDVPVEVKQRTENEIAFEVPRSLLDETNTQQKTISATIDGLVSIERDLWLYVRCSERSAPLEVSPAVAFLIDPPVVFAITGKLRTTHMIEREVADLEGSFDRTGSDRCDDSFSVDQNICLTPGDGTFSRAELWNERKNCGSHIGPITPSGDRCVLIGGHVRGCGAIRGPFRTWVGCNGRGWIGYNYRLWKKVNSRETAQIMDIERVGIPNEKAFSFVFPAAVNEPEYEYEITIDKRRGERVLERRTLNNANPTAEAWNSRVADGMLAIEVQ